MAARRASEAARAWRHCGDGRDAKLKLNRIDQLSGWVLGTEFATGFLPLPEEDVAVTRSFEAHCVPTSRRMVVDVVRKMYTSFGHQIAESAAERMGRLFAAIALMTTRSGAGEVSMAAGTYLLQPAHQAQILLPSDCSRSPTAHGLFTPPSCRTAFQRPP